LDRTVRFAHEKPGGRSGDDQGDTIDGFEPGEVRFGQENPSASSRGVNAYGFECITAIRRGYPNVVLAPDTIQNPFEIMTAAPTAELF
jgi:hypothetical protein